MRFQFVENTNYLSEAEHRPVAILWLTLQTDDDFQGGENERTAAHLKLDCVKIAQDYGSLIHLREDGLTAVFGIPKAYEDDAVRAVLAAQKMFLLLAKTSLRHSKVVVSYNHIIIHHNDDAGDISIDGEALDQAKLLAFITPKSKIWVTGTVQIATSYFCQFKPAETTVTTAVSIWEFLHIRDNPDKPRGFVGQQTSFIGRDTALQSIIQLSQNLDRGVGGIIWIEGEAGIGKSRLMREFTTTIAANDVYVWAGGCSPKYVNHAFSLFTSLVINAFNIQSVDTPEEIHQKIEDRFQEWPEAIQNTQGYLEILAGIQPIGDSHEKLNQLQPEQLRQQTFVATRRLLKTVVKNKPIVILCDDLHWIDPVSAELLQFIATMAATDPVFFVCAQRRQGADTPNFRMVKLQSLLPGYTHRIYLDKLTYRESSQLIDELIPGANLPEELYQLTISRSAGNPYFIEEFVRMFIEQGHLNKENGHWQINFTPSKLSDLIPVSLDTLIHARIDALPDDLKLTLQQASIIGAQFDQHLLEELSKIDDLAEQLERLELRLMISNTAVTHHWNFKHILFHTIVYNAIPIHQKQTLHLQVATALQKRWSNDHKEAAKELAYHFTQAAHHQEALPYLIIAGEFAANQYANEEAVQYFQQAKSFTAEQHAPDRQDEWRIAIGLGVAYRNMGQYEESISALEMMLPIVETETTLIKNYPDLLQHLGETYRKKGDFENAEDTLKLAKEKLGEPKNQTDAKKATHILSELAWVYFSQGQYELARKICEQSLLYARQAKSLNEEAKAENLFGGICYRSGDWQEALQHTTKAMVYREQIGSSWDVAKTYDNLGILAFAIGHWSKAVDYFQKNLTLRLELGDVEGIAITQNNLAEAYKGQGKLALAETHYRESLSTARLFNIHFHIANSSLGLAQVLTQQKKYEEAQSIISDGMIKAKELDSVGTLAEMTRVQAELFLARKLWDKALEIAQAAVKLADKSGHLVLEAECWRISSEAALNKNQIATARSFLDKAKGVLAGATDELEKGLLAAQSYQINKAAGDNEAAQADFNEAKTIFTHLGATQQLEKLSQLSSPPSCHQ